MQQLNACEVRSLHCSLVIVQNHCSSSLVSPTTTPAKENLRKMIICWIVLAFLLTASSHDDGPFYDHTAYTKCIEQPQKPLYDGGILSGIQMEANASSPSFNLHNLTQGTNYCFSIWVKIKGAESSLLRATLTMENTSSKCIGSVLARRDCWSFLKGGFTLHSASQMSTLSFDSFNEVEDGRGMSVSIASASLQPFTDQQWRRNQQHNIRRVRKRAVLVHVSDPNGVRMQGVNVSVRQISKEFPFGASIAKTILGNGPYQKWFLERFNAAVFENELKWYATEPEPGKLNYTLADQMLEFVRANQIVTRGHNIFWEDPKYTPSWVRNLTGADLESAVKSRIQGLLNRYKEEFVHWDVSNEMLHFDFYEQRLGRNATLDFFKAAHESDPLATLFMNEFNVVETCADANSNVDGYVSRLRDLKRGGVAMDGIGLESHFSVPNLPLMRGIIDKLATLGLPIWLTEVDISNTFDKDTQAVYLEQVLREGFSHPFVSGMMLWSALRPTGCYQMCLTDSNFVNLPTGDIVDKLLREWKTGDVEGQTDEQGSFSFVGFLGEYSVNVGFGVDVASSTFALSQGVETKHVTLHLGRT